MTTVERKLASFAAALRSRRCRSAMLLLLGWIVLAQAALAVHAVDHATAEKGAPCVLCAAGDHLAGTTAEPAHYVPPPTPDAIASTVSGSIAVAFRAAYRSRAPPAHPPV